MDDEEFYLSIKSHTRKIEDVRNLFKNLNESEQATLEFEKNRAEMVGLIKKYLNNTSLDKLYTTRKIIDEMIALVLLNETKNAIHRKKQQQQQQQKKQKQDKQVRIERVKSQKKLCAKSIENLENIEDRVIFLKNQNSNQNHYNSHHQYGQYHYFQHHNHYQRHSNHNHKRKEAHSEEIDYYLKYLDDLEHRRKHSPKQDGKLFMTNCEFNFETIERTIAKCISPSYIR